MKSVCRLGCVLLFLSTLPAQSQFPGQDPGAVLDLKLVAESDKLVAGREGRMALVASIKEGWHINSHTPKEDYLIPTVATLTPAEGISPGLVEYPKHLEKKFVFSEQPVAVYEGKVVFLVPVRIAPDAAPGPRTLRASLAFQSCNDQQCMPPAEVSAELAIEIVPAGTAVTLGNPEFFPSAVPPAASQASSETSKPTPDDPFGGRSLPLLLALVFVAGLALNLTPCVYPLIPITIGFFGRQSEGKASRRLGLAALYVLGMSVTYSVLGVVASLSGSLFGAWLQKPAVLVGITAVILALALSMFGLFEIRAPHFITDKSQGRGGAMGALTMGLFVGFVAAPCIGPFVLSLLNYVAIRGSAFLGFILFFTLSMGLGVPYLVLGVASSSLQKLPRSGEWMVSIRKVFGFILCSLAVYFLRPLIPGTVYGYALAAPLLLGGIFFLFFEKAGSQLAWFRVVKQVIGLLLLAGAVLLGYPGKGHQQLPFQPYSDEIVERAKADGKDVMIDFYADWCLPCKELDEKTFSDQRVGEALSGWVLLKVDLTKDSDRTRVLKDQWNIKGVPTIVFLGKDGKEKGGRVIGFEPPATFLSRIKG